jgi:hypothetical protein
VSRIASMKVKPTMGFFGSDSRMEELIVELKKQFDLLCVSAFWDGSTLVREYRAQSRAPEKKT